MNFESFFSQAEQQQLEISFVRRHTRTLHQLSNEALFQLPLIALIVLLLAKDRRKPRVSELGQLVGETIEGAMPGFKGSSQHLGWSAYLRLRTIAAMTFLENTNLIEVELRKGQIVTTALGAKVVGAALKRDDDLSYNLAMIERAYRNVCVARQLDLVIDET